MHLYFGCKDISFFGIPNFIFAKMYGIPKFKNKILYKIPYFNYPLYQLKKVDTKRDAPRRVSTKDFRNSLAVISHNMSVAC